MNKVYFGDCRDSMRQMAKDGVKVQACITSPPYYGLRDYGHENQIGLEHNIEDYVANLVDVFSCVWDVLKDDGTLWLNLGDSYSGSGKGPSNSINKPHHNLEKKHSKIVPNGLKPKDLIGVPWRVAFALQDFGWYLRQDIIWHKPNPMPESVTDRCTKAHEYIFLLSKSQKYFYNADAIAEPVTDSTAIRLLQDIDNQKGSDRVPNKTNGTMKAVGGKKFTSDMGGGGTTFVGHSGYTKADGSSSLKATRNKRSVWTVNTKPYKGAHFAVYPEELVEPMVLASTKVGDLVLDPFFGSGTTGAVAQKLGRKWVGCELNKDYEPLQFERLKQQALELI